MKGLKNLNLQDARKAMKARAALSGLEEAQVKMLRLEAFAEGHELDVFPQWAGFKIPYFGLDGRPDKAFYRFRFLQDRPSRGWGAKAEPAKPRRYGQPAGTRCGVYLPPLLDGCAWKAVARDPGTAVVLTEGEMKAACGCLNGFPTIGLGGVFNWRSARDLQELLPELEAFEWAGRQAYVAFDSDLRDNAMVRMAASRLAAALARRGARVYWAELTPAEDGSKRGVDDFIVAEGREEFGRLLMEAEELGPGVDLHRINSEVAVVRSTAEVVQLATGTVWSPSAFSEVAYKPWSYMDRPDGAGQGAKMVRKWTAKEWLGWPLRTEVARLEYDPGCPRMLTDDGAYNTWFPQGWGCAPSGAGDMEPWERLFGHVLGGATEEERRWVRQWMAAPVQSPGAKLSTAVLLWGRQQGTGKTFLGETMRYVYGRNYGTVNAAQLESAFTEWAESRQFIVADELAIGSKRELANTLKDLVTRTSLRMNIKNRKTFQVRDCINYWLTSNHEDAVFLENHDRRIFVHHVDVEPMPRAVYKACDSWLKEGGGARLFHHLLHEVDCSGFDPQGPAPRTAARAEMTAAGRGDLEDWAVQLRASPDTVLLPDKSPFDLYRTQDLLRAYDPDSRERVKSVGMGRALGSAGVFKLDRGRNNAVIGGVRTALWAVRNEALYKTMGSADAGKAYEAERLQKGPGPRRFEQGRRAQ
jgi:Domain of unknown function (DUF3854)/Family of unknown function (DUF5906)